MLIRINDEINAKIFTRMEYLMSKFLRENGQFHVNIWNILKIWFNVWLF